MKSIQSNKGDCLPETLDELQKWLKDLDWLQKTIDQIQKDFDLSGISYYRFAPASDLSELRGMLEKFLTEIKGRNRLLDQLLYKIDLPVKINALSLDMGSLTDAIILRSFQKVWLRKTYSEIIN